MTPGTAEPDPLPVSIRPLRAEEWRVLKDLRIRALDDAPDAFGPTAAEARAEPDAYWRSGARDLARAGGLLVLRRGDAPVGLVSALVDAGEIGHVGAMWIDPGARGGGLGARLLDAASELLAARGSRAIELWVTEGNERASALYASRGFTPTGVSEPLREGSALRNVQMRKSLRDRGAPSDAAAESG
jgi:ribosomal protein S18 acetylase RimI-like enzyme